MLVAATCTDITTKVHFSLPTFLRLFSTFFPTCCSVWLAVLIESMMTATNYLWAVTGFGTLPRLSSPEKNTTPESHVTEN